MLIHYKRLLFIRKITKIIAAIRIEILPMNLSRKLDNMNSSAVTTNMNLFLFFLYASVELSPCFELFLKLIKSEAAINKAIMKRIAGNNFMPIV